jgi:hypothetical protein
VGINLTKICCKYICHNEPLPVQIISASKNVKKEEEEEKQKEEEGLRLHCSHM